MLKVYNPKNQCSKCMGTGEIEINIATPCKDAPLWEKYKEISCSACEGTGAKRK
jgi:DnaJ-class molecular chaperone